MQHFVPKNGVAHASTLPPVFLRMPTVIRLTGLGRSTIYRLIAEDKFPCPVRLGLRAVAWRRSDLDHWSEARPTIAHRVLHVATIDAPNAVAHR